MVNVRRENGEGAATTPGGEGRLNMLLSYDSWRPESWADLLPRLLAPMGVTAYRVHSGREATEMLRHGPRFHVAVVDLALPLEAGAERREACREEACGARLLQLLERLPSPPPTVVINRQGSSREREAQTAAALRHGAFSVVQRPVDMELMLEVFRRLLQRHYQNRWPGAHGGVG
jgi:CheY-like chemotaxis protein